MGVTFLEKATWEEVSELSRRDAVAIIPTGSCEQHGPHLPLNTDSFLVSEVATGAAEKAVVLKPKLEILITPVLKIGRSPHHLDFSGSLSLTASTYVKVIEELCYCLSRHSFKRILLLNGHGANGDYLRVAARNVRDAMNTLVGVASYWALAKDGISRLRESDSGGICHAGEMETSCMLYLNGESVRKERIRREMPQPISKHIQLDLVHEGISVNHNVSDFSKTGTIGDPTVANFEKGQRFFECIVTAVADFITDFGVWKLENLGEVAP